MSNGRLRVLVPNEGSDGKTHFTKIGMAFPLKNRPGYSIKLDAHPIGKELVMFEDDGDERGGGQRGGSGGQRPAGNHTQRKQGSDDDDGIPF